MILPSTLDQEVRSTEPTIRPLVASLHEILDSRYPRAGGIHWRSFWRYFAWPCGVAPVVTARWPSEAAVTARNWRRP
jgi:hypothetical protein